MKKFLWLFCFTLLLHAKDPKTVILIISSDDRPVYPLLEESWRSYMHSDPDHFECYFLKSDPNLQSEVLVEGDVIWTKQKESRKPGIIYKTMSSLEYLLPRINEFDYLIRTNLSSFYVFPRLLQFLKNAPKTNFYSGIPLKWRCLHNSNLLEGIQGSGIIVSSDLIQLLHANKKSLVESPKIDDVAIAMCLSEHQIPIISGKFFVINNLNRWETIKNEIPEEIFHFRVKSKYGDRVEEDLLVHKELFNIFYEAR